MSVDCSPPDFPFRVPVKIAVSSRRNLVIPTNISSLCKETSEMDKRFVLSAAGFAGAAVAAPALAGGGPGDATLSLHLDFWAGEHSIAAFSDNGQSVVGFASGGYLYLFDAGNSTIAGASLTLWNPFATSPYTSGYRYDIFLQNATGNYTVTLGDTYGDGWAWAGVSGSSALVATDSATGNTYTTTFFSSQGFSASGSFVVATCSNAECQMGGQMHAECYEQTEQWMQKVLGSSWRTGSSKSKRCVRGRVRRSRDGCTRVVFSGWHAGT